MCILYRIHAHRRPTETDIGHHCWARTRHVFIMQTVAVRAVLYMHRLIVNSLYVGACIVCIGARKNLGGKYTHGQHNIISMCACLHIYYTIVCMYLFMRARARKSVPVAASDYLRAHYGNALHARLARLFAFN